MKNNYIEIIKVKYPDLTIRNYYLNEIGQNNDVYVINKELVFRFPKYESGIVQLRRETEILDYISDKIHVAIPKPLYQSLQASEPGKVFMGYPIIDGEPLWNECLKVVNRDEYVKELASQLVSFLTELHAISLDNFTKKIQLKIRNPREEMQQLYENIQSKLFSYMRKDAQLQIVKSFETALNGNAFSNIDLKLVHGDFGASNILWNEKTMEISGIIDFGNCGIGDPAYDFAGICSSYGEDFFELCLGLYPNGSTISERVKFYQSTFALQEALHGIVHNDQEAFECGIRDYR